jgi:hypothetical protein
LLPAKILESCSRSSGPEQEPDAQLRMQAKPEDATWFHCFQSAKLHRRAMATARRILTRRFREPGGKGSFQAVKLQRPARTTVCSHSTRDIGAIGSIETKHNIEDTQYGCLSSCGQLWSEAKTNAWTPCSGWAVANGPKIDDAQPRAKSMYPRWVSVLINFTRSLSPTSAPCCPSANNPSTAGSSTRTKVP